MLLDILLVALPLALFVALAAAFLSVFRRAAALAADTRAAEQFRRRFADAAGSVAGALTEMAATLDAVRHGAADPAAAADASEAARRSVASVRDEVAAIGGRERDETAWAALRGAVGRADEALAAATAACRASASAPGDADGQTAVKRAYLGVVHACDAVVDLAAEVAAGGTDFAQAGEGGPSSPGARDTDGAPG
jgi:hypothetical protein